MIGRRRFLVAGTAALGLGGLVARDAVTRWRGTALGAPAAISLRGPEDLARPALAAARAEIARIEALFSLHRADSALVRLNRDGALADPDPEILALLALSRRVHDATGGAFDPTVQPLLTALATGGDDAAARRRIGLADVEGGAAGLAFARPGMALTFNGLAQGHAADRVAAALRAHGFPDALVDAGEIRAGTGRWRVGVEDPARGLIETRRIEAAGLAASSPGALLLGTRGAAHIVHPKEPDRAPLWTTVAVEAWSAALADAVSTAAVFLDSDALAALPGRLPGVRRILAVPAHGAPLRLRS